jgi:hypothetical protein
LRKSRASITGARQVKFSQTYAVALPSIVFIPRIDLQFFRKILLTFTLIGEEKRCRREVMTPDLVQHLFRIRLALFACDYDLSRFA